jgi:hypothetical protein
MMRHGVVAVVGICVLAAVSACDYPALSRIADGAVGGDDGAIDDGLDDDARDLSGCPAGYTSLAGAGTHRYRLLPTSTTWVNQRDACIAESTHLAVPRASAELAAVVALSATPRTWIGINDLGVEGNYRTVLGLSPSYVPWDAAEPDNGTTMQQDCVAALSTGAIATDVCTTSFAAVCECDAALSLSLMNINDGDTGVSRTLYIDVLFNQSLVASTISGIQVQQNGSPFTAYTLPLSMNDTVLTFHWNAALPANTVFSITFPLTLQDTLGRTLEKAVSIMFITGA